MKILHVITDDKFIDMAIREFEAVSPGVSEFVLIDAIEPYQYIKHNAIRNLTRNMFIDEVRRLDISAVIFHSLPETRYCLLEFIPPRVKVFWLGWGYDYYNCLLDASGESQWLMPDTLTLNKSNGIIRRGKSIVKKSLQLAGLYPKDPNISVLGRIDYFSPVLDVEYRMAVENNPWFSPKYICWNYGTVEDDLTLEGAADETLGKNLLVGNSATPTNNHYEIIKSIHEQIDLTGRKVIVPLSYGDPNYREQVLRIGRKILGDAFTPLVDFMPREHYISILTSCGFVMMNHLRQQALGNICISTLLGAKIFLHNRNLLHGWLHNKGMVIGDIEQIDTVPLTNTDRITNKQVIHAHWGRQVQREKTRNVVKVALS